MSTGKQMPFFGNTWSIILLPIGSMWITSMDPIHLIGEHGEMWGNLFVYNYAYMTSLIHTCSTYPLIHIGSCIIHVYYHSGSYKDYTMAVEIHIINLKAIQKKSAIKGHI